MQVGDILSSPAKRKDHHRRAGLHHSITLAKSRFQENLDRFEADLVCAHIMHPLWTLKKYILTTCCL